MPAKKAEKKKRRTSPALKLMIVILLLLIAATAALGYISYNRDKEMQAVAAMKNVVDTDAIYNNIYINGVHVGGMTKSHAAAILHNQLQKPIDEKNITLTDSAGSSYELPLTRFDAKIDINTAVDEAYAYGRDGGLRERFSQITSLSDKPYEITAIYSFDISLVYNAVDLIADRILKLPFDATITRRDGVFYTTKEEYGRKLNTQAAAVEIISLVTAAQGGVIELDIEELKPRYREEDFNTAQSLIGSYTSDFAPGDTARNTNLKNACSKINDTVVYPGEIFSTNAAFGAMTYDNGYRSAPVIVGNKLEDGMGGGVCQVSSALYMALLYAELEITERQNHSLKVGYANYGFDATLAGDYIDLKFKNDTPFPVFIESYIDNGKTVVVNIYGHEKHSSGRTLKFENQLVETVAPASESIIEDASLAAGSKVTITAAKNGYRYKLFKIVYENNDEVERVQVNTSYYKPVRGEARVGTGTESAPAGSDPAENRPADIAPAENSPSNEVPPDGIVIPSVPIS